MKRNKVIKVRLTEEEEFEITNSALANGLSLSDEIRKRLFVPQNNNLEQKFVPQRDSKPLNVPQVNPKVKSAKDSPNRVNLAKFGI